MRDEIKRRSPGHEPSDELGRIRQLHGEATPRSIILSCGEVWKDLDKGFDTPNRIATASWRAYHAMLRRELEQNRLTFDELSKLTEDRGREEEEADETDGNESAPISAGASSHQSNDATRLVQAVFTLARSRFSLQKIDRHEREKEMPTTEHLDQAKRRQSAVLSFLKNNGPQKGEALRIAARIASKPTWYRVIKFLVKSGEVVKTGARGSSLYSLAGDSRPAKAE